ncbi:MAG: asparagine synthase (glutamine-hydrolyzing) [Bacteroidia bacterium]|nr:asparagine synthase (glutamine-hydrolyzing) [Bacteroidia bacterium]
MCGIFGAISTNITSQIITADAALHALKALRKRGPNNQQYIQVNNCTLAHARLAIIDTTAGANQPFTNAEQRYYLVFNGEIFNYKTLRNQVINNGATLTTQSDTEVLYYLLIQKGIACVNELNGFFAFAFYDSHTHTMHIARDRYGIKPLYIYQHDNDFAFASEPKALRSAGCNYAMNTDALSTYFHLNYLPHHTSIFKHIHRLAPATYLTINTHTLQSITHQYYSLPTTQLNNTPTYATAKQDFKLLLENAVTTRLVADVPLGCFLSGGIDSSVITGIAAQHTEQLNTFSIGFKDTPYYDETRFAEAVSKHNNTKHHSLLLSNADLYAELFNMLDYIDEPFADSSAINVYILSKYTAKHVTVALSGDGADELLGGYNKHAAMLRASQSLLLNTVLKTSYPLLKYLPEGRTNKAFDALRKIKKYGYNLNLTPTERYWSLAGFGHNNYTQRLLKKPTPIANNGLYDVTDDFNSVLTNDLKLVLEGDMLHKVDRMSMANSIEVRNPFLDVNVVNYVCALPSNYKIDNYKRKKLLIDTFDYLLPNAVKNRSKRGFEVPLQQWLKTDLYALLFDDLLSPQRIAQQNIFNYTEIQHLRNQLLSSNVGDTPAKLWALLVFQYWYKSNYE